MQSYSPVAMLLYAFIVLLLFLHLRRRKKFVFLLAQVYLEKNFYQKQKGMEKRQLLRKMESRSRS